MKFNELFNVLEQEEYNIGDLKDFKFYRDNEEEEVRIGVYARISKKDSVAIERQIESVKSVIKYDWELETKNIRVYKDNGVSGTSEKRSAYKKMMDDIECGVINTVITTNIDRFGRLTEVILNDIYCNGNIKYLYISIDNKFINAMDNKDILLEEAKAAEKYASKSSVKSKNGLKIRMKRGSLISSKPPYGYKLNSKDDLRCLELADIEDVKIVRNLFYMYVSGKSIREIAKKLNEENISTPSGKGIWTKGTIKSILSNPLYSGVLYQGRYRKLGYSNTGESKKIIKVKNEDWIYGGEFEGIINADIFKIVQDRLNENKNSRTSSSNKKLFTSLIKCGDCGRALVYRKKANGYNCSGAVNAPYNCKSHLIKENELNELISVKIKEYIMQNINDKSYETIKNRLLNYSKDKAAELRLEEIKKNIDFDIDEMRKIYGLNDTNEYKDKIIKKIKEDIDSLELKKKKMEEEIKKKDKLEYEIIKCLDNISKVDIEKNAIYALLVKEIRVYKNNRIEIEWRW